MRIRPSTIALLCLVLSLATYEAQAQTQATCSFNLFSLNPGSTWIYPAAVNDYGTIVGLAQVLTPEQNIAFVQWPSTGQAAGVGVAFPFGQHAVSMLSGRNDNGTSIGYMGAGPTLVFLNGFGAPFMMGAPILLNGTASTPIQFSVPTGQQVNVNGINNWGSIVGAGNIGDLNFHGFKRWSNGNVAILDYPGAAQTVPTSINDDGSVVGYYTGSSGQSHGFLYVNGKWAPLDYPNATQTSLSGISNAGVIVGNAVVNGAQTAFLYENGTFKVITITNNPSNSVYMAVGISARKGLILITNWPVLQGFTATCQ
jgi:probable HAF family extracellular repeat protein